MNYIGSKLSLLDFIDSSIQDTLRINNENRNPHEMVFADLFAGTGIVGQDFKRKGFNIISNDLQYYSYVINKHYIENNNELIFEHLSSVIPALIDSTDKVAVVLNFLNNKKDNPGFIYNNYCLGGTKNDNFQRMYFTDINGIKCDSIRTTIEDWHNDNLITDNEYFYLLSCLITSVDKCANTASVYGAFLKHFKKSAQKEFTLSALPIINSVGNNIVYNEDVNTLIQHVHGDILYLDPPYNERQYSANYHLLETIAKYDEPYIQGKTGLRDYKSQKSLYCSNRTVLDTFDDLIRNANFRYIFLSYNNEGLMSLDDVKNVMSKYGQYSVYKQSYKRFRADTDENRNYKDNFTTEFLHVLVKE